MRALALATGLAFLPWAAVAAPATDNPLATPLDQSVQTAADTFFKDACHVGLSLAVYDHGAKYFYNYGSVSKHKPELPTQRTLYEIGSVTKTFTGILAARALIDGKMTLDGDFRNYLKTPYPNLERSGKAVTLRTLAGHTSGLPRDIPDSSDLFKDADFDRLPFQLIAREKTYDRKRYLNALHEATLATTPGETMAYSNIGIKLVSFGVENVYGRSFESLLKSEIVGPLDMKRTGLHISWLDRGLLAQGYGPGGGPMPHILPNAGAAGGLYSNTEDLVKYAAWQAEEADPVVRKAHEPLAGTLNDFAVGLIWDEMNKDGERKLWHSGGVYGMSSQLILFPDTRQAYVLLANDACFNTQGELDQMATTIHAAQKTGT